MMVGMRLMRSEAGDQLKDRIMEIVAKGEVLVGTIGTLAAALEVTATDLRSGLRELLEAERIAVHSGPPGQIVIRLERRRQSLPPLQERRRLAPDVWIF
jgi:hypothetical protein